jgi:hypothetical protein
MDEDQNEEEEQEGVFDDGLENEVEIDEAELLTTESDTTTDTSDDEDEF